MKHIFNKDAFFLFFAGIICVFAQAPFDIFPVLCASYGILFYMMGHKMETVKQSFWGGYCFGFGYFLGGLYWVGNALLVDIAQFFMFLPFAYLGLPMMLGLFYAVACGVMRYFIKKDRHILLQWGALCLILGVFDIIRGFIFTGFPWNLPVYSTAFITELMQPAYYVGIYAYNFIIIGLALSFGFYVLNKSRWFYIFTGHIISVAALFITGYYHIHTTHLTQISTHIYRIIQPNIAQKMKWSDNQRNINFQTLLNLSSENIDKNKNYVFIWPETAMPFHPETDKNAYDALKKISADKNEIIMGKMRFKQQKDSQNYDFYNSVYSFSKTGIFKSEYDKMHLVPFGEYLPFAPFLKKIGFGYINHFQSGFKQGTEYSIFSLSDDVKIGSQICYEIIFPQYTKSFKDNGADIILNLTNDAWFGNSAGPYQHLAQVRFRAVENGMTILRSANTGISAVINPYGQVIKNIRINNAGYIDTFIYKLDV